jgi:hypothetical protein
MKKIIVFLSLFVFGLFCWFYKDNNPATIADKKNYQIKKDIAAVQATNISAQLQKIKPKRMPSSQHKTALPTKRVWKYKDFSRLPAKKSNKKHKKKSSQKIQENLAKIKNTYFIDQNTLETPAGDVYISDLLKAVNKNNYDQAMGNFYTEINKHVLFKSKETISLTNFNPQGPSLVTMNKNSGKMGILTGKIVLEMKPEKIIENIINKYNLEIIYHSKSINVYYLEMNETGNLHNIITQLRENESVVRADLEILDNIPVAL